MRKTILTALLIATAVALGGSMTCPIPAPLNPADYGLDPNMVNYDLACVIQEVEGAIITKTLTACDPDGDPLAYRLLQSPAGMNIQPGDPNEVVLGWVAEVGVWYVDVEVYDMPPDPNDSLFDRGTLAFIIRKANKPPVFGGCR